ncbi:MAG: hypothetical protein FWG99_00840 [Treponema sp.]|nr:hypothetical protein [Treponema sp.]
MKKITIFGLILVLLTGVGLILSCEGPAGPSGKAGLPGLDGTGGLDGIDGIDGLDGGDGTYAIDPIIKAEIEAYIDEISADLGVLDRVFVDLDLPSGNGDIKVAWLSTVPGVVSNDGVVNPLPNHSVNLVLTGFFSKGGATLTQVYVVNVPASSELTLEENILVAFYMEGRNVVIDNFMDYYHNEVLLPNITTQGSLIEWTSSHPLYPVELDDRIANFERSRVKVTDTNNFDGYITLTATFTHPSRLEHSYSKNYQVKVLDKHFTAYLMTYFTGGSVSTEQMRYALTRCPYGTGCCDEWTALNNNEAVAWGVSDTGGIRDPYIQRGNDGNFYLTGTDMHSGIWGAWSGNRGILMGRSSDLLNWTTTTINISRTWPGNFGRITTAWAPEYNFDRKTGKYQLVFAITNSEYTFQAANEPGLIKFRAFINQDFSGLEHEPARALWHPLDRGSLDMSIFYYNDTYWGVVAGGNRNAFFKAPTLQGPWEMIRQRHCQDGVNGTTNVGTEGGQWFRQIGTETYVFFWDRFQNAPAAAGGYYHRYGYRTTTDMHTWDPPIDYSNDVVNGVSPAGEPTRSHTYTMVMTYNGNHGSIIPLTEEEYQRLANATWPTHYANNPTVSTDATLRLHYTFTGTDVVGSAGDGTGSSIINRANPGTHDGKVMWLNAGGAGADIGPVNGIGTFYTGTSTATPGNTLTGNTPAYVDMGEAGSIIVGQNDYTIATYVWLDGAGAANNTGDGNLVWAFSDTDHAGVTPPGGAANDSGKYVMLRAVAQRAAIAYQGNRNLSSVSYGENIPRGQWVHVMYRQAGQWGTIYNDGLPVSTMRTRLRAPQLVDPGQTLAEALPNAWLGRSMFRADQMMRRARYADFRMYSGAISEAQIAALNIPATLATLNGP